MACTHVRNGACEECWQKHEARQASIPAPVVTEEEANSFGVKVFRGFFYLVMLGCGLKAVILLFGNS